MGTEALRPGPLWSRVTPIGPDSRSEAVQHTSKLEPVKRVTPQYCVTVHQTFKVPANHGVFPPKLRDVSNRERSRFGRVTQPVPSTAASRPWVQQHTKGPANHRLFPPTLGAFSNHEQRHFWRVARPSAAKAASRQ